MPQHMGMHVNAYHLTVFSTQSPEERIHLPRTQEAEAMQEELLNYEIKISDAGHDTYGAFKTGKHDDLVTALGFRVFYADKLRVAPGIAAL